MPYGKLLPRVAIVAHFSVRWNSHSHLPPTELEQNRKIIGIDKIKPDIQNVLQ